MTQEEITQLEQALTNSQSKVTSDTLMVSAFTKALSLANDGYESDQQAIADAVTAQVGDVQTENGTLKAQVEELTADSAAKDDTISDLTAKLSEANDSLATALASVSNQDATITELQTYKDNHPDPEV